MSEQPSVIQANERPPMPIQKKSALWKNVLAGIIILVSGIVIGAGGTLIFGKQVIIESIRKDHIHGRTWIKLKYRLDLSPAQEEQIDEILKRRLGAIEQIREKNRPYVIEQFDMMKEEVAAVLDEEQRQVWLKRIEQIRDFWRRSRPPKAEDLIDEK